MTFLKKMHPFIKIIPILITILITDTLSSQSIDSELAVIGELIENSAMQQNPEVREIDPRRRITNNPEQELLNIEDRVSQEERKDFTDEEYGFTGGKDFNSPPKSKFRQTPLEHFGYSFFQDLAYLKNYNYNLSSSIPSDFIIGPQDVVRVMLYGNMNKTYDLQVTREGQILMPDIGPLYIAGMSFDEVRNLINMTVKNSLIGVDSSVTLGAMRSIDIFIMGAASRPGLYNINSLSTITDALILGGGIDLNGSLRNIKLKRKGKIIETFDFYDLFISGDSASDVRLIQGDIIFIEPKGKTSAIDGEVHRPGIYELKENEDVNDLIRFAGNTKSKANLSDVDLTRINKTTNSFEMLSLDLKNEQLNEFIVQDGDSLTIYPVANRLDNAILVVGHAQKSGFFPWFKEMRISDLFKTKDSLIENTDINYVLISRKSEDKENRVILQVDLDKVFKNDNDKENIFLEPQDEITILPSLLTLDFVTTKLVTTEFSTSSDDTGQKNIIETEQEWRSVSRLRKSILDDERLRTSQKIDPSDVQQYYEYNIFDYCQIPAPFPINLNQSSEKISMELTNMCRRQLIDPIIDKFFRYNSSDTSGVVSVFGNVNFPGDYPTSTDMTLKSILNASGWLKNGTYKSEIEITSQDSVGKEFVSKNSLSSLKDAEKIYINAMDKITVKQIDNKQKTIKLTGEVFFPGLYPISDNETLSEVIARAGGLTSTSFPKAAFFQRESIKQKEIESLKTAQEDLRRRLILGTSGVGETQVSQTQLQQFSDFLNTNDDDLNKLGRLVIDLDRILKGEIEDVILEDLDKIFIPKVSQVVTVIGEVYVDNSHVFNKSLSIEDYIELSGGYTPFADNKSVYLIKADGRILSPNQLSSGYFRFSSSNLEAGDTIVVPLISRPFNTLKATTEITQIIYQMALAAAAVNSF